MLPSNPALPVSEVFIQAQGMLPELFRSEGLISRNLMRNLKEALSLDPGSSNEEVGKKVAEFVSSSSKIQTLDARSLLKLGKISQFITEACRMAELGVLFVPGVRMSTSTNDLVFPNGRALKYFDNKYDKDYKGSRSPYFDLESGGLLTIPGHEIIGATAALYTAEGRMLIALKHEEGGSCSVIELPSAFTPNGRSHTFDELNINWIYNFYPMPGGEILALMQLLNPFNGNTERQLINIETSEMLEFNVPGVYISDDPVYSIDGDLFVPLRKRDEETESVLVHQGDFFNHFAQGGQQVASVLTGAIVSKGIYSSEPRVWKDGSVRAAVIPDKEEPSSWVELAEARSNSDAPFNKDNFPLGNSWIEKMRRPTHITFAKNNSPWIKLETPPEPAEKLQIVYTDQWIVTLNGDFKRSLLGLGKIMGPPSDNKAGVTGTEFLYTRSGMQIAQCFRECARGKDNKRDCFDMSTGKELYIDNSRVVYVSEPQILPDGREILPVQLEDKGYFLYFTETSELRGLPGFKLSYIDATEVFKDANGEFYMKIYCKRDFEDQRYMKI